MTTSFDHYPPVMAQAFAALAAQVDRTSAEVDKAMRGLTKLEKLYGSMANNQGAVTEEFFVNSLSDNPVLGDVKFDTLIPNLKVGSRSKSTELDIVLVNGESAALVEIKYKVHLTDLEQLEKHMGLLKTKSKLFKGYKIYGGIAGFSVPKDVIKAAHERGFFVLQRKGNVMTSNTKGMRAI